jgi:hypothetical protein
MTIDNMLPAKLQYPGSVLIISCQDIEKTSGEILQPLRMISPKHPDNFPRK